MIRTLALMVATALPAAAQDVADMMPRDGWVVTRTAMPFDGLVAAIRDAAAANGLAVVTQAGPTGAAARRGIAIPGNRVLGLFNNDLAVRLLQASTPAMSEAPMRVYVTENADGTATLSYEPPSVVLAPYASDASDPGTVQAIGADLDAAFTAIAVEVAR
ncbi:DUF302 domain-containing protein [Jannaschia sp. LMIT008]|uniref:DUF302 domain-containing protein n=1 Tax=Jannaschia maritima TaxID=3032585 RepID=UPI0028120567|nr:DUF302 domain-containing protein [Jannaschia sp. LMIT008]